MFSDEMKPLLDNKCTNDNMKLVYTIDDKELEKYMLDDDFYPPVCSQD